MRIKTDSRQLNVPTIRCCLCTIGIGNTIINCEWYRHITRKPLIYNYENTNYILCTTCYELVVRNPTKLKNAYKLKD